VCVCVCERETLKTSFCSVMSSKIEYMMLRHCTTSFGGQCDANSVNPTISVGWKDKGVSQQDQESVTSVGRTGSQLRRLEGPGVSYVGWKDQESVTSVGRIRSQLRRLEG